MNEHIHTYTNTYTHADTKLTHRIASCLGFRCVRERGREREGERERERERERARAPS